MNKKQTSYTSVNERAHALALFDAELSDKDVVKQQFKRERWLTK